jgi:hypothetical protein
MPKKAERALKKEAKEKGFTRKKKGRTVLTERGKRYVYGALRRMGWRPRWERK